jgi:hypothetical protein
MELLICVCLIGRNEVSIILDKEVAIPRLVLPIRVDFDTLKELVNKIFTNHKK